MVNEMMPVATTSVDEAEEIEEVKEEDQVEVILVSWRT